MSELIFDGLRFTEFGVTMDGRIGKAKRGTETVTAGNTTVNVTHGLEGTPTIVKLTPLDDLGGRNYWVTSIGATTFTINISSSDLSDHQFTWEAEME
jgi:hypothetical protein